MIRRIIILLFIVGYSTQPQIKGCTTATACNYNSTATQDDGSCVAPQGCNEWCAGDTLSAQELDICDICGGDDTSCSGCTVATACNYDVTATNDDGSCIAPQGCNEWCEGDTLSAQEFDCVDVCGGTASIDS